jgi:predicted enzyme related to lactoylglutathione lyase
MRNRLVVRPGVLLSRERLEDAARTASAKTFYTSLSGWTTEVCGGDQDYTLFKRGEEKVGGMVKCPQPGLPAHWLPYVLVEDVDAIAARAKALGDKIVVDPFDVPAIGRMAVLVDPQGEAIAVLKPAV